MAQFDPEPPPLDLPVAPDVLSPNIPLNPPMVGEASPFIHVDGQNRDIILESIRTWVRVSLLPWTTSWQVQLTDWETDAETKLNAWMVLADAYITEHAISGLSVRTTATAIAGAGTTNVVFTDVDEEHRPLVIGDLVLSQSIDGNYGIITALIDATHATVTYLGSLRGPQGIAGLSFRTTATPIAGAGPTIVEVIGVEPTHPLAIGDIILTTDVSGNFGYGNGLIDDTHIQVGYLGTLRGPQGIQGVQGAPGVVQYLVAGASVTIDSTDPAHPIVSASGIGTGIVQSVVAGTGVTVVATDPANPIVNATGGGGIPLDVFPTSGRPEALVDGDAYFDSTLIIPVWSYGGIWRDSDGNVIPDAEVYTIGGYSFTPVSSHAESGSGPTVAIWDWGYLELSSSLMSATDGFGQSANVLFNGSETYMFFRDDQTGDRIFCLFDPTTPAGSFSVVQKTDLPFSIVGFDLFRVYSEWIEGGDLHFLISLADNAHTTEATHHLSWSSGVLTDIPVHASIASEFWMSALKYSDEFYLTIYGAESLYWAVDLTSAVALVDSDYTREVVAAAVTGDVLTVNSATLAVDLIVGGAFDSVAYAAIAGSTPSCSQIFDYDGVPRGFTITWMDDSTGAITSFIYQKGLVVETDGWFVDDAPIFPYPVATGAQLLNCQSNYIAVTNYDDISGFGFAAAFHNYVSATWSAADCILLGAYAPGGIVGQGLVQMLVFDRFDGVTHRLDIVRISGRCYSEV